MNYYDELGISPQAKVEEIRDAYLQLVRLLHPDKLQDERQRSLAELQMKRLNHIYETLSDPDQRRAYDVSLMEQNLPPQMAFVPEEDYEMPHRARAFGPQWLVAAALGGALFAYIVTRINNEQSDEYFPPASVASEPAREAASGGTASRIERAQAAGFEAIILNLRSRLQQAERDRDAALARLAALGQKPATAPATAAAPVAPDPVPPAPIQPIAPEPVPAQAAKQQGTGAQQAKPPQPKGWGGRWHYIRPSTGAPAQNMYPPEFIEAALLEDGGMVRGRYRARYKIADRAIPPEVEFQFTGKVNQGAMAATWLGPGGAKGDVRIRQLSADTIEVAWVATDLGRHQGLGYGTAVLVRRQEP